jgi:hypothetical protein
MYYNYKGVFSIVLMAIVDADYRILYANCGAKGRVSDGGVFQNTTFCHKLQNGQLPIPGPEPIINEQYVLPYVLVADNAFPLTENIMKPYPGTHEQGSIKRVYNYRLSRARRVVENVFGIICSVFRIFQKPILLHPDTAKVIVMTCLYLHNFLRREKQSRSNYMPSQSMDTEDVNSNTATQGSWRREIQHFRGIRDLDRVARRPTVAAAEVRNQFADYFMSPLGSVPWQNEYA